MKKKHKFLNILILLIIIFGIIYLPSRIYNEIVFRKYINNEYNKVSNLFKCHFRYFFTNANIRGVHGNYVYDWIRSYSITCPFMEKPFEVWIDNRTHKIFGDNFYDILKDDPKFQHLYSNWVKKQIGCEDEDVEMKFYGTTSDDAINIDFNKISSLDNEYDELFDNINGYYCNGIKKKNIINLYNIDSKSMAEDLRKKYLSKAIKIKSIPSYKLDAWIELYCNDFNDYSQVIYYIYDIKNENDELRMLDL